MPLAPKGFHLVWRVQNIKDHGGPYRSPGFVADWRAETKGGKRARTHFCDLHFFDLKHHPRPKDDGIPEIPPGSLCGFFDYESFLKWFNDYDCEMLWRWGFELVGFFVPEDDVVALGYTGQCFFYLTEKTSRYVTVSLKCAHEMTEMG